MRSTIAPVKLISLTIQYVHVIAFNIPGPQGYYVQKKVYYRVPVWCVVLCVWYSVYSILDLYT